MSRIMKKPAFCLIMRKQMCRLLHGNLQLVFMSVFVFATLYKFSASYCIMSMSDLGLHCLPRPDNPDLSKIKSV